MIDSLHNVHSFLDHSMDKRKLGRGGGDQQIHFLLTHEALNVISEDTLK